MYLETTPIAKSTRPLSIVKYHGYLKLEPHEAFSPFCANTGIRAGYAVGEFGFYEHTGLPVPAAERERLAQLVSKELSIYSKEVFERSKLKRIVLCSSFKNMEAKWGGCCYAWRSTIFLDSAALNIAGEFARKTIHHELYHMIDYHDDVWRYADPVWMKLNTNEFSYYGRPKINCSTEVSPGFVSDYARSNVCEDKAETYAHMIVSANRVLERAKVDCILSAKIERMQTLMNAFSSHYDERFWSACLARSVEAHARDTMSADVEVSINKISPEKAEAEVKKLDFDSVISFLIVVGLFFVLIALWVSSGH